MATVVIIGLLTAVAIPAYVRYIRRARTVEVHEAIDKVCGGAKVYYQVEHLDPSGTKLERQFPAGVVRTPSAGCCAPPNVGGRCVGTLWTTPTWQTLTFNLENVHFYQYQFDSAGAETTAKFTAYAFGDLDCDGTESTWQRRGSAGDVEGSVSVTDTIILPAASYDIE